MNRIYIILGFFCLMSSTALANRLVIFNPETDWPESFDIETPGFGPMPTGYYIITKDDVEVEFQMNDEMENMHDAYYYRGKMNIYTVNHGIKMVSFSCRPTTPDASFTLLYQHNYNYTQNSVTGDDITTVFEFFDTFRDYVGFEGLADIISMTITLDNDETTQIPEDVVNPTVSQVRYFNVAGQEIPQPCGLTIRHTIYCNGSTAVDKLVK